MINNIFLQISILLGITVSVAFLTRLLKQPLMVAYILAGIVAGPFAFNLLHGGNHTFEVLADFGVVLLLFMVGLSLNFDHIKRIGKVSIITGVTQLFLTSGIGFLLLNFLGYGFQTALFLALAISFSSTIIVVKLLTDKQDSEAVYGRFTLGLMIVQDIAVVLLMVLFTTLSEGQQLVEVAPLLLVKIFALLAFVYLVAKYIIPSVLEEVAESTEFLFIFTIAWCFGIASLLHWMGFSIEIGGIIAGLTLGSSKFQREISSRIKPLRDFFIILFFIILGSELSLTNLNEVIVPGLVLSAFILLIKPFITYHTYRMQEFTRRNSFLGAITPAQVSEFGFVILITASSAGFISGQEMEVFTLTALITIITSSYMITYDEQLYRFLLPAFNWFGEDEHTPANEDIQEYDVWVFGYHRIGWKICDSLEEKNNDYAVVDFNPKSIEKLEKRGIPHFFGDAADVEFIESLPLEKANLIISTLPEPDDQATLIKSIRKRSKNVKIIANLHHIRNLDMLYEAGANYVMLPHLLGGSFIAEELKNKPWDEHTFKKLRKEQEKDLELRFTKPERDEEERKEVEAEIERKASDSSSV